ncbi:TPA: hypothetical protein U1032_000584 [Streptococcus suis]|nr:hypothetical protein [Streptococcus suis]HEM4700896.1 hypothetical protein [Streptococcus suis]HEM4717853.1 hypothetical protein [Streptococcus suis]HEM4776735.1 hypothetical protein [Streptococcus suis]HEM4794676.1 hypothetical protein [Streptococcus suis]
MIKPILNAEETVKGTKVLLSQKAYFLYLEENGKRVKTDTVAGYSYECVAIEKQFERFNVKIEHAKPLFQDSKAIPQNCIVEFLGLTGSTYVAGDNYKYVACSFKAEGIEVVDDE